MADTDVELVRGALAGSERAFLEIVRRYERPVFALIVRMVRNPSRAEELAQDTFVKVFSRLHTCDQRRSFSTWVLAIAHHTAVDELRRSTGEAVAPVDISHGHDGRSDLPDVSSDSPARLVERAELAGAIERAIGLLRPEYRELVVLKYQNDLGHEEIAEVTGLPVGTIKSYLHRARKELSEHLSAAGWGPSADEGNPAQSRATET